MTREEFEDTMKLGISNGRTLEHIILKQKVLEILRQNWVGLDMSINSCDEYYIKKIEEL